MSLDSHLSVVIRTHILSFLIGAFQSLDNGLIRKECAPLVSISIWQNLSSEAARERKFEQHAQLKKVWRAAAKRYDSGDEASQAKLRFDRAWLYSMLLDFIGRLQESSSGTLYWCVQCHSHLLTRRQKIRCTASGFSSSSQISRASYLHEDMSLRWSKI